MIELMVDSLAVYGAYTLTKKYWARNKDRIKQQVASYISDVVRSALYEAKDQMSVNIALGDKK